MKENDKLHVEQMINMPFDGVIGKLNERGYDLQLIKRPHYVWFSAHDGMGEDAHILLLKTYADIKDIEYHWDNYLKMIEAQRHAIEVHDIVSTAYADLEDTRGIGYAFANYLLCRGVNAENIEIDTFITGW
ncbi:MAG: hypothetical protein M0P69_18395 [Bacteroidales bacterium]|nr:hypothetical protein [Bacteroidales bacterium]